MKTRHLIGLFLSIIILVHFVTAGMVGFQSKLMKETITIEKAVPAKALKNTLNPDDKLEQDRSIFSKTTIISLLVAVIGIVAFRRNNYS